MMRFANVFEIKKFAVHDGDGIRTTVFLKGCPLRCAWCHNPEGLSRESELSYYAHKCIGCGECAEACERGAHIFEDGAHKFIREKCIGCGKCAEACLGDALKLYGKRMSVSELLPILLEDRLFYEQSGGGVTISGGECLTYPEFCEELLCALKDEGINTAVDTSGFVSREALTRVMPYTDVFLYDLKAHNEDCHIKCTAQSNRIIIENLEYLNECEKAVEIRIPYVPGMNSDQMEELADYISLLDCVKKVRVLAYHNYAGSKYLSLGMENTLPEVVPTDEEMERVRDIFRAKGIKVVG